MSTTASTTIPFVIHGLGEGVAQAITTEGRVLHRFRTDAYPAFGGNDAAPSPLFYALAALSSCNQVTASLVARELGITLGTWRFDVRGELDPAVLVGGADGNANFARVEVRAEVETDATVAQFATLVTETERRCPVSQLFKRSGLVFDNQWTARELTAGLRSAS